MGLAKVTSKGQITIPIQVRKKLNLKEGDKVVFITKGDKVLLENFTKLAIKEARVKGHSLTVLQPTTRGRFSRLDTQLT